MMIPDIEAKTTPRCSSDSPDDAKVLSATIDLGAEKETRW